MMKTNYCQADFTNNSANTASLFVAQEECAIPGEGAFIIDACGDEGRVLTKKVIIPSYIVMKISISLQEWVHRENPPPLTALCMFSEICNQVSTLHLHGLVHREVVRTTDSNFKMKYDVFRILSS